MSPRLAELVARVRQLEERARNTLAQLNGALAELERETEAHLRPGLARWEPRPLPPGVIRRAREGE